MKHLIKFNHSASSFHEAIGVDKNVQFEVLEKLKEMDLESSTNSEVVEKAFSEFKSKEIKSVREVLIPLLLGLNMFNKLGKVALMASQAPEDGKEREPVIEFEFDHSKRNLNEAVWGENYEETLLKVGSWEKGFFLKNDNGEYLSPLSKVVEDILKVGESDETIFSAFILLGSIGK